MKALWASETTKPHEIPWNVLKRLQTRLNLSMVLLKVHLVTFLKLSGAHHWAIQTPWYPREHLKNLENASKHPEGPLLKLHEALKNLLISTELRTCLKPVRKSPWVPRRNSLKLYWSPLKALRTNPGDSHRLYWHPSNHFKPAGHRSFPLNPTEAPEIH